MKWSEFIDHPSNNKEPHKGVMMIILQKDIRPQPVFSLILSGQSFNPADYGYAMADGKIQKDNGVYLSDDMLKLKCWCEQHEIKYSFDFFSDDVDGPFLDSEFLQLCGDFTQAAIESFPIKYKFVTIRGTEC